MHNRMVLKGCLSLFLFLLGAGNLYAVVTNDFTILKNLNEEWMVYDQDREGYVPHALQTPLRTNSVSFMLDLTEYNSYTFRCCVQEGTSLFIDQKIASRFDAAGCHTYSIDSLREVYEKKWIFITLYNPSLASKQLKTLITGDRIQLLVHGSEKTDVLNIQPRESAAFKNFFILGLLLLLAIMAALYNLYPKSFREYFGIAKVFTSRLREESIIASRPVSTINTVFLAMYCALLSFLLIVVWHQLEGIPPSFRFVNLDNFTGLAFSWALFTVIVFFAIILKFLLVAAMSSLFNMKLLATVHFFDFVRISLLFMILTLGVVSLSILSFPSLNVFNGKLVLFFMLFLSFIIVLVLFLKLIRASSFRNLQLFSYLCTTEILPFLIGFKFFLNL